MAKGAKKTRTVKKKAAAATTATAASRAAPRTAYVNARLIDPASGLDAPGGLLSEDGLIADFGSGLFANGAPENAGTIDCRGRVLAPGLVDMRVRLRDPGHEHREATVSAAAGGITTIIVLPDTDPVIDSVALVEFIGRRAGEAEIVEGLSAGERVVVRGVQKVRDGGPVRVLGEEPRTDAGEAAPEARAADPTSAG